MSKLLARALAAAAISGGFFIADAVAQTFPGMPPQGTIQVGQGNTVPAWVAPSGGISRIGTDGTVVLRLTSSIQGFLPMGNGGCNASLTPSKGGIIYSTAFSCQVLPNTPFPNSMLLSGLNQPAWSIASFSPSYAAYSLLYSNGPNNVQGLATAANSVLVTNSSGVPSISQTLPTPVITSATINNSPSGSNDYLLYWNAASNSLQRCTVAACGAAGASGVTSLGGLTGAVLLGTGLTTTGGTTVLIDTTVVPQLAVNNNFTGENRFASIGIGISSPATDFHIYSSTRAVWERFQRDQTLSIGHVIGNQDYWGQNSSGTSTQWALMTGNVNNCLVKISTGGGPCWANENTAGNESGAFFFQTRNGSSFASSVKIDDDGLWMQGARNVFIPAGQGIVIPDGSTTQTYVLSYNTETTLATPTITIASPAVVTSASHGRSVGDVVRFSTTGALPTGITAGVAYYVISAGLAANTFEISASPGGSAINTSGSQSGTHTAIASNNEIDFQSCNNVASGLICNSSNTRIAFLTNSGGNNGRKMVITAESDIGIIHTYTHVAASGTAAPYVPTLSSCGSSTVTGDDHAGHIVISGSPAGCTMSFGTALLTSTSCVVTGRSGTAITYTANVNGITITALASNPIIDYVCFDR